MPGLFIDELDTAGSTAHPHSKTVAIGLEQWIESQPWSFRSMVLAFNDRTESTCGCYRDTSAWCVGIASAAQTDASADVLYGPNRE